MLVQKVGFYAATIQYQHMVIPIPLGGTIRELFKMSDEIGQYQKEQTRFKNLMANINGDLVKSSWTRFGFAKLVNNIYAIINLLPVDLQITKRQIGEIFGAVGTLMRLFT